MSDLRALLLTDVVDSTKLSVQVGDAEMARVWAAHDRAARDLLPVWRGREIDKTDGMLLLFDSVADAVGYALAYQHALKQLDPPLKARAGLHAGPVTLRENSAADVALGAKPIEVEGVAKATAARIMSVAMGGQILLSADAQQRLANGTRLQSHGHWQVKGLEEPIELFEIGEDHAAFTPPPDADKAYRVVRHGDVWSPVREIRHSLPAEGDSFVGRTEALAELSRQFRSSARLVSILGIGGTGKTRLATRYGRSWLGEFPGGVWFCDLAPARSVAGITSAVAQALDVPLGRDDPVVQLGRAIAGRGPCLVIFDNFEQVARHAAQTVGQWLARTDQARFIVTTREVLGLPGEVVMALPPLPPTDGAALFVQRANAAKPEFQTNAEDESAIAPLVALLDGLPLAIELAAARVRVMPPRMILVRMGERFKLLASKGGRLDRQATLRAALDWSWDLLPTVEKAALAQLSVFEGGFTLEAAEHVLDLSGYDDAPWAVDALNSLVDKSLIRSSGDDRFDLLVSVQAYAAEHLKTEGRYEGSGAHALASAQQRHIAWFAALEPDGSTDSGGADLDNLVAACQRAVAIGDGDSAAKALAGAKSVLMLRGPYKAAIELAASVCAMPALSDRAAAHALLAHAGALAASGQAELARTLFDGATSRARAAADRRCEARVTYGLGDLCFAQGRMDEARAHHEAAIGMAQALDDRRLECSAVNGLGTVQFAEGRNAEALRHYERALELARETGYRRMQGGVLSNLANLHAELGHMAEARRRLDEALASARAIGDRKLEGVASANLGELHLIEGRLEKAAATLQSALAMARELGHVKLEYSVDCNLGVAQERLAHPDVAQKHFEAAVRMARELGDSRSEGTFLCHLGLLHARQGRHADAQPCFDSSEAVLRGASHPLGVGLLLTNRAEAHHLAGDGAAASACLAEATAIAVENGAEPTSGLGKALARARALIEV
jgi:predicted ATPase